MVGDSEAAVVDGRVSLARERKFLGASAVLFLASAGVTIYRCNSMSAGMPMPGGWTMSMAWMRLPGQTRLAAAASFMGMWAVMMIAMMLPSLVPTLLHYRRSVRAQAETPLAGLTTIAAGGYFFVWVIFGVVVYPLGVSLSSAEMQWPAFMRLVPLATGVALLLAGGMQLTRWKARRLGRCRDAAVWKTAPPTVVTAWQYGFRLGVDCSLCCLGFMTVLLVLGVMSLTTMAAVTAAITVERLAHNSRRVARVLGLIMIAASVVVTLRRA